MKKFIGILFSIFILSGCGEGKISIGSDTYEPKIVIEGYLIPDQKVERIRISRNFPINSSFDPLDLTLSDATVTITDVETQLSYSLSYNNSYGYYEYNGAGLSIGYEKSYRLDVGAVIDGIQLTANSTTTTPADGFSVVTEQSVLDSMIYRERDALDALKFFKIAFNRSAGTQFYATSLTALDASTESFIYSPTNPFGDIDTSDVIKNFNDFKYRSDFVINTPAGSGISLLEIQWFHVWFYGNYQLIAYAGDQNYKDFALSHADVKEIDGNYHEPVFHINGDGIGVFGSVIADTVYFKVLRQ